MLEPLPAPGLCEHWSDSSGRLDAGTSDAVRSDGVFGVELATATRTVMFTDLSDYSAQVSSSDREGLRRLLDEHEHWVEPLVLRHGGQLIKNLGDSFLCTFPSATEALKAALEIISHPHIRIRAALNTGDVEEIGGDVFGGPVNIAARILAHMEGNQVWFGRGTFVCMNTSEIPWEFVGKQRFKGIPGEQPVFRTVRRDQCFLPENVIAARRQGRLVRVRPGYPLPMVSTDSVVIFEGFEPTSRELEEALRILPVLEPASLLLSAYQIAPAEREVWASTGRGFVIGTAAALEKALQMAGATTAGFSRADATHNTLVLENNPETDLELVLAGLALPEVPLSEVVEGYTYDLLEDGRWVTMGDRAVLRVKVEPGRVSMIPKRSGISVDGRLVEVDDDFTLGLSHQIGTPSGMMRYLRLTPPPDLAFASGIDAHPYIGMFVADTRQRLAIAAGVTVEIGREPNHPGFTLPDRQGQENIRWCSGPRAMRARQQRFTLDRALAGRRQCAVHYTEGIYVSQLHERLSTYVVRNGSQQLDFVTQMNPVNCEDVVIAGTTVLALRKLEG